MVKVTFTGDYNTFFRPENTPFKDLIHEAVWRGVKVDNVNGDGKLVVEDISNLNLASYLGIASSGLVIDGYPVYIKMSSQTYASNVPDYLPEAVSLNDDLNVVNLTWANWKSPNHEHLKLDSGEYVVPGNSWGYELNSVDVIKLSNNKDYSIISREDFINLLPVDVDTASEIESTIQDGTA